MKSIPRLEERLATRETKRFPQGDLVNLMRKSITKRRRNLHLLKYLIGCTSKLKHEVPWYKQLELIDWINEMSQLFDFEKMEGERQVNLVVTRL